MPAPAGVSPFSASCVAPAGPWQFPPKQESRPCPIPTRRGARLCAPVITTIPSPIPRYPSTDTSPLPTRTTHPYRNNRTLEPKRTSPAMLIFHPPVLDSAFLVLDSSLPLPSSNTMISENVGKCSEMQGVRKMPATSSQLWNWCSTPVDWRAYRQLNLGLPRGPSAYGLTSSLRTRKTPVIPGARAPLAGTPLPRGTSYPRMVFRKPSPLARIMSWAPMDISCTPLLAKCWNR